MHKDMGYSREEIENMVPYERDIIIGLYNQDMERQKRQQDDEESRIKSQMNSSPKFPSRMR